MPDIIVVIIDLIPVFPIEQILEDADLLDRVLDFVLRGQVRVITIIRRYFVEKDLEWLVLQPRFVGLSRHNGFFFSNC